MLRRVSFVPFELGHHLSDRALEGIRNHLGVAGATSIEAQDAGYSRRIIPSPCQIFERGDGLRIVLDRSGFGLLVVVEDSPGSSLDIPSTADAIVKRRAFHREVCAGRHELSVLLRELRDAAQTNLRSRDLRHLRPDLFAEPPYVLSVFFAHMNQSLDDSHTTCISALLEPTRIEEVSHEAVDSDELTALCNAITEYDASEHVSALASIDHSTDTKAFASWAGLVIICDEHDDLRQRQYEALEIRAQVGWSIAHYLRRWAEEVSDGLEEDIVALSRFETRILPRLRNLASFSTGTTRQAGIFSAISETSQLDREIATAEETLRLAHQADIYRRSEGRRRISLVIESLLAIVALSQVLPLVTDQPMVHAPAWAIWTGIVVFVALMVWWNRRSA